MMGSRGLLVGLTIALILGVPKGLKAESPSSVQQQQPSPAAIEAIKLLESSDPYQRQLGFLRLEALRELSSVGVIKRYADSRDPQVRAYSFRALAAIQGADAVPELLHALYTDKQPIVRRSVLLGLEPLQQSDPAILPVFLRALLDRNTEVRMTAVDIVSRIDDPRAHQAILTRYKRERRRDVRRVLDVAIKRVPQS